MGGPRWNGDEDKVLLENYPSLRINDLLELLPGRTHAAISVRVKKLRESGHPNFWRWKRRLVNLPDLSYSELEKTWLACAIDTDGTIGIETAHEGFISPYMSFSNTKKVLVDHFHELSKPPVTVSIQHHPQHEQWNELWSVKVRRAPWLYAFLKEIKPYLIAKAEQASLSMQFLEIQDKRRDENLQGYGERQWELHALAKELNRRGTR